jgi:hypothetical protein
VAGGARQMTLPMDGEDHFRILSRPPAPAGSTAAGGTPAGGSDDPK